jgi:chromosome segregation ATPase
MLRPKSAKWLPRWIDGFVLVVMASLLTSAVHSQDLAALARKERARRAKITKPVKVLTEEDGRATAEKGVGSVTTIEGTATSAGSTPPQSNAASREAERAAWKARAISVAAQVDAAEARLEQLEQELAEYRSDRKVLTAAEAQDPMRLQKRESTMADMNKAIELQKTIIADARKSVAVFEEEARRSGVPPGWLR